MFPSSSTKTISTPIQNQQSHIPSEIIQVPMPSPVFYFYNEENNSLDNCEKNLEKEFNNFESRIKEGKNKFGVLLKFSLTGQNLEKEFNDFESRIKEGKNKFGVLLKFSLAGQYEIKLNISYSIRHRDIEDYIWFTQEETLKFIVIEPFKLSTEVDSSKKNKNNFGKKRRKIN